jgi:lipoprotein-releasing system ATP-binding protein
MSILSLERVCKHYPDGRHETAALEHVSFDLDVGDFVGIWGIRRSGKSTLLRVAAGRELPDEGSVRFDGDETLGMSADRRARLQRRGGIGLLTADWRPERNKPVIDHVALPLLGDGMSLRDARHPAWAALERVGIAARAHTLADRLSNSERIRVALAQMLVREPRVLLVDEPAVLVRPSEAVELYELLCSLGSDLSLAVVIASEDITPIRKARRMFTIESGTLRAMDQPGKLVQFPERTQARQRSQP